MSWNKRKTQKERKQNKTKPKLSCILELLGKYHRAQSPLVIRFSISSQVWIRSICTFIWQMSCLRICSMLFELQFFSLKMNDVDGHFCTQTCGVLQPCNGTNGSIHFSRLKNSKYGLSITLLSTPHFRPFESVGTIRRSKSPWLIALHMFHTTKIKREKLVFDPHGRIELIKKTTTWFFVGIFRK